jgi:hypothetical protein
MRFVLADHTLEQTEDVEYVPSIAVMRCMQCPHTLACHRADLCSNQGILSSRATGPAIACIN